MFVCCVYCFRPKKGEVCDLLDQGLKIFYLGSMEIDIVKWLKLYIFPNDYTLLPFFIDLSYYRQKIYQSRPGPTGMGDKVWTAHIG